jgi:hypothetical protein
MKGKRKRKTITSKNQLVVIKRDRYTCKLCGRSPVTHRGVSLEVDHIEPFSLGGANELNNYQMLCSDCNKGKGNDPNLNRTRKEELDILLDHINPQILKDLHLLEKECISVVVNQEEYKEIIEKNSYGGFYEIIPSTNTIMGYQAGKNLGIYTLHDTGGSKVNFFIKLKQEPQ